MDQKIREEYLRELKLERLTEEQAKEICDWEYEGDYAVYNYPSWNIVKKCSWGISDETKRVKEFMSLKGENDTLFGYIRMMENDEYVIIGIGLKPICCGKGLGSTAMELLKKECFNRYKDKKIILQVRSFNTRAIKCYEKSGFKRIDILIGNTPTGKDEFIKMEYIW